MTIIVIDIEERATTEAVQAVLAKFCPETILPVLRDVTMQPELAEVPADLKIDTGLYTDDQIAQHRLDLAELQQENPDNEDIPAFVNVGWVTLTSSCEAFGADNFTLRLKPDDVLAFVGDGVEI